MEPMLNANSNTVEELYDYPIGPMSLYSYSLIILLALTLPFHETLSLFY